MAISTEEINIQLNESICKCKHIHTINSNVRKDTYATTRVRVHIENMVFPTFLPIVCLWIMYVTPIIVSKLNICNAEYIIRNHHRIQLKN